MRLLIIFIQFGLIGWFGLKHWEAEDKAFHYEARFEASRSEIEALYRTKGFRIQPAYKCYSANYLGRVER